MLYRLLKQFSKKITTTLTQILVLILCVILPAQALFVRPPKDPMPLSREIFPAQTKISEQIAAKEDGPLRQVTFLPNSATVPFYRAIRAGHPKLDCMYETKRAF